MNGFHTGLKGVTRTLRTPRGFWKMGGSQESVSTRKLTTSLKKKKNLVSVSWFCRVIH